MPSIQSRAATLLAEWQQFKDAVDLELEKDDINRAMLNIQMGAYNDGHSVELSHLITDVARRFHSLKERVIMELLKKS
jgi:hypothetical protein